MKTISKITLVLLMASMPAWAVNYNVPQTASAPTIDGVINAAEYADAIVVDVSYPHIVTPPREGHSRGSDPDSAADFSNMIYMKWDAANLYIAFDVTDDIYSAVAGRDEPQICFNLNDDPAATFLTEAVVWNLPADSTTIGTNGSNVTPTATTIAGSVNTGGQVVELALAWSDFNYTPTLGDVHGMGFALQDHDADNAREHFLLDFGMFQATFDMTIVADWSEMTLITQEQLSCGDWGLPGGDLNGDCANDLGDFAVVANSWMACTDANDPDNCVDMR